MKKNTLKAICLTAVALALAAGGAVGGAMAYFTTYVTAKGGYTLELGFPKTEIEEDVEYGKKVITLSNTGEYDCYVRLKALTGAAYKDSLVYSEPEDAGNWAPGADGYYYYNSIVAPQETTSQLLVRFSFPKDKEPSGFNVIIIQECTPVLYDEYGTPHADWNMVPDVSQSIYKGEDEQ